MPRIRRVLALAFPASLLATLGIALPAQAAPSVVFSCSVSGTASTFPPVKLTGGSGSYSFDNSIAGSTNAQFNCNVDTASGQADVEALTVTSTGTYANIVCGTGSVDGTNTGITATSLGLPDTTDLTGVWTGKDLSYHINFLAGQGYLVFSGPNNPLSPGTSNATGGGEVTITVSSPQTDGMNCTDAFKVTGALTGAI
jgi:hypothetical protein